MAKRRILVVLSDEHAGHRLCLCNPEAEWDDFSADGEPCANKANLTRTQEWYWEGHEWGRKEVKKLAGRDEITLIHNGDITWGQKYPDGLIAYEQSAQVDIAFWNLKPWLDMKNVKVVRMMHGTQSHEYGTGSSTKAVTSLIAARYPKLDIAHRRHALFSIDGVSIDVAHHGTTAGIRQWTTGNQLRYYMRSLMNDELARSRPIPRLMFRAHYHTYVWETLRMGTEHVMDGFITPAFAGMTHYASQATRSAYLQGLGMIAIEIVDGEYRGAYPFIRHADLRTEEEL